MKADARCRLDNDGVHDSLSRRLGQVDVPVHLGIGVEMTIGGFAAVLHLDLVGEESDDHPGSANKVTDAIGWQVREIIPINFDVVRGAWYIRPVLVVESFGRCISSGAADRARVL